MSTQCNTGAARKSTSRRPRRPRRSAGRAPILPVPPDPDTTYLDFPALGPRQVLASFKGGDISSDGGALLLRQVEAITGIIRQFAACFTDHRDPDLIEHTLLET
jgi:hypothetical protein